MKFKITEGLELAYYINDYQLELKNGKIDLVKLLNAFQNLAISQIESLGMGSEFEKENTFMYVVLRYKGVFLSTLQNGKYKIVTYPMQASTLQMYRYFALIDDDNNILFYLISLWVMVDSNTRRIKPAKAFKNKLSSVIKGIESISPLSDEKLDNFQIDETKGEFQFKYKIKKKDIDSNMHMNNTVYLSLAFKIVDYIPKTYEINYEKECFYNETLFIYLYTIENNTYVYGIKEDGSISFKFSSKK